MKYAIKQIGKRVYLEPMDFPKEHLGFLGMILTKLVSSNFRVEWVSRTTQNESF